MPRLYTLVRVSSRLHSILGFIPSIFRIYWFCLWGDLRKKLMILPIRGVAAADQGECYNCDLYLLRKRPVRRFLRSSLPCREKCDGRGVYRQPSTLAGVRQLSIWYRMGLWCF